MNILDIILARAMTPQGKTETYVAKANKAAAKAEQAKTDAETAIATVEAAADEIATAKSEADDLLATAQEALETVQEAQINQIELYSTTGQNTDGTMTQKAITDALTTKAETSALADKANITDVNAALATKADINALAAKADKTYVDQQISTIPHTSNNSTANLGSENAGKVVIVGDNGNVTASSITEDTLAQALFKTGLYEARHAVGLDIDYENKTMTRIADAATLGQGSDFDVYTMYGGRTRCNVDDTGRILAFYGDAAYRDDGSNGQVMVYQPKFYYQRLPLKLANGTIIKHESLVISDTPQPGFKLHPLFTSLTDGELDYILLPAYDGAIVNDKMTSIAGVKPVSNLSIIEAEAAATARGSGWHITTMAAESAMQMLQIVEYGSMNGQESLERGICDIEAVTGVNCASLTGSTASLGNITGYASSTINEINGTETVYTDNGKRAISYRGSENPWGNLWNFVGGVIIKGDGHSAGGAPYICTDFNYTPSEINDNYEYVGFNLPSTYGWISAMGYSETYDWVFMPAQCATTANSTLPVGDNLWTGGTITENKICAIGGTYAFKENNGLFYYACDKTIEKTVANNYGAHIMFIPTKNTIYTQNIANWQVYMGA